MTKQRLIFIVFLIVQFSIISYSQIRNNTATTNKPDECKNVIPPLACDIVRFACELNIAISKGNYPCVKQIADKSDYGLMYLPTKSYSPNDIPIVNAVLSGHPEIVSLLYEYNSDTEVRDAKLELTPLLWASNMIFSPPVKDSDNLQIIDFLIKKGADIDAKDKYGNTPLIGNARWGRYDYVKMFAEHSANPNLQNENGETALMISVDDEKILNLLASSNLLVRDLKGRTAIFYAIEQCQPNKFKFLLNRNQNLLKIPDKEGVLPYEFANKLDIQKKCPEIAKQIG